MYFLFAGYRPIGSQEDRNPYAALQGPNVYARFNYLTNAQPSERDKFRFKPVVHFFDDEVDTAVLELEDPRVGHMPLSFTYFSLPRTDTEFRFIGHSENDRKAFNVVDKVINLTSAATQADIVTVRERSLQHCGRDYEFPPHNVLNNRHRYLLHCKFTKGASGSPGVVVLEDGRVVVVTMLLCGYPDWFYNPSVDEHFKVTWPNEFRVEQGVNMKSVYEKMMSRDPNLCRDIFNIYTDSLPNPELHV
jgi:hypothetical protein